MKTNQTFNKSIQSKKEKKRRNNNISKNIFFPKHNRIYLI
jgi:hypothetical protein